MTTTADALLIDEARLKDAALIFRAINNPLRQRMLHLIDSYSELLVSQIYKKMRIEQSVASQHLGILRAARLVTPRRDGRFIHYRVNHARLRQLHRQAEVIIQGGGR